MRIELRGRTLGYEDTGGPQAPLVLLHGFPLDRTVWSAQARGLSDVARVIAPDLRGFGESRGAPVPCPAAATTMDDYAADVAELLDALGVAGAVIGGVSMGGYVAMAFHRAFADRVRGLVLVATRAGPDSDEARGARDAAAALARERGTAAVAEPMIGKMLTSANGRVGTSMRQALSAMMSGQPVEGVVGALAAIRDRPDSAPWLRRIAVPTLVVCGIEDRLIPPRESEVLRDSIPGARLTLLSGAGHLPNFEQPEAFNRVVRGFLGSLA